MGNFKDLAANILSMSFQFLLNRLINLRALFVVMSMIFAGG